MPEDIYKEIFTPDILKGLFPPETTDRFFEALFGDADDGAFDIELAYAGCNGSELRFQFSLRQRHGKCLACNLTSGLPQVFSRHPVIDVKGIISRLDGLLDGRAKCVSWTLGRTRELSRELHVIPLTISLEEGPVYGPGFMSRSA